MRRIVLPLFAAALATAGAAAAQPPGSQDGYAPQAYPQAMPRDGQTPSGYDQGYDEDDDRGAPPPGASGYPSQGSGYGPQGSGYPSQGAGPGPQGYGEGEQGAPDLSRELGLRADQQAALRAYQQATTPSAADEARMEAQARSLAAMTTPQRLDAIAAQMRRDEAAFAGRADAVRRFYAQLTPAQQRRFDQISAPQADGDEGGAPGYGGDAAGAPPPR